MAVAIKCQQSWVDRSNEISHTTFYIAKATPVVDAGVKAAAAGAVVSMLPLTVCNVYRLTASVPVNVDPATLPGSENAQREKVLWVQMINQTTGKFFNISIPGPDLNLLAQIGTDEIDYVSNVTAAAFAAILEANLVSPDSTAGTVSVTRMRHVGRNR